MKIPSNKLKLEDIKVGDILKQIRHLSSDEALFVRVKGINGNSIEHIHNGKKHSKRCAFVEDGKPSFERADKTKYLEDKKMNKKIKKGSLVKVIETGDILEVVSIDSNGTTTNCHGVKHCSYDHDCLNDFRDRHPNGNFHYELSKLALM